jgi:hypothetical protein
MGGVSISRGQDLGRGSTIARLVEGVTLLREIWFIGRHRTVIGGSVVGMGEG